MSDEKLRVLSYTSIDDKVFVYHMTEDEIQKVVKILMLDIWFFVTDEEFEEYFPETEKPADNLKEDFIWFTPRINDRSIMQCTCNNFIELDTNYDRLIKKAVRHARRSGHTLNPRGN